MKKSNTRSLIQQQARLEQLIEKAHQVGFYLDEETYTLAVIDGHGVVFLEDVIIAFIEKGVGSAGAIMNSACNYLNAGEV